MHLVPVNASCSREITVSGCIVLEICILFSEKRIFRMHWLFKMHPANRKMKV
jgi:hypothetical protein